MSPMVDFILCELKSNVIKINQDIFAVNCSGL